MATTVTHNHVNYQARFNFIQQLLQNQFHLKGEGEIVPIQYDPECPFKYNNFVYRVSIPVPLDPVRSSSIQPGCVPIPNGTKEFIMRLNNAEAEGMSRENRTKNEVAIISLASSALAGFDPHIVPYVYAWGSAGDEYPQGWIMQEFMPGTPLDEVFQAMNTQQKREVLEQKARILKGLQDYQLPEHISFGGVTFDDGGHIVSSAIPTTRTHISKAGEPTVSGIDSTHLLSAVSRYFQSLATKNDRAIIHADFTFNNILFDTVSGRITALIDYDFACISHPSYEFLCSFHDAGGQFPSWSSDQTSEEMALREAKMSGIFPSPLPAKVNKYGIDWEVAQAWERSLEKLKVNRPSNIPGIDKVADVDSLLRSILPWRLSNSDILRRKPEEETLRFRANFENKLIGLLEHIGF